MLSLFDVVSLRSLNAKPRRDRLLARKAFRRPAWDFGGGRSGLPVGGRERSRVGFRLQTRLERNSERRGVHSAPSRQSSCHDGSKNQI